VVLIDTSVWIDHLRRGNDRVASLLEAGEVVCHPLVIGELACGSLQRRQEILALLAALTQAAHATEDVVLGFIESHHLHGKGVGLIDVHLLWAAVSQPYALWTHDKSLRRMAERLAVPSLS
jgi:predicted nucleic acid-binding protein